MQKSKILYRFLDERGAIETIKSKSFRIGRIPTLNDPFEFRPGIIDIEDINEEEAQAWIDTMLNEFDSIYGITCFSETLHEPVLWSHYADKHKGMAFEVDYLLEPVTIKKVRYTKKRVCIDSKLMNERENFKKLFTPKFKELVYRKSNGWKYEREWRGFVSFEDCKEEDGHFSKEIPDDFLLRVILGHRCEKTEEEVRELLDQSGFDYVKVSRAKLCNKTYKVKC